MQYDADKIKSNKKLAKLARKYYRKDITEERAEAFNNLCQIDFILNELNYLYFLDGGTLLGAVREQDFCEDDHDDIDLTIISDGENDSTENILKIIETASRYGFSLYHYWKKEPKTTAQISLKKYGLKIDIMFKRVKGKSLWWTIYGGPNKITYKRVPAEFATKDNGTKVKLKEVEIRAKRFLAPYEATSYLTCRYGNWKTKVHRSQYSCYQTDKAIVKSYEEI